MPNGRTVTFWDGLYCGPAPEPADLLSRWNYDPVAIGVIAVLALLAGRNRAGVGGVLVLAIVLLSPLCALSSALFSARVLHHVLLIAVAAPLFALVRPPRQADGVGLPFALMVVVLWFWHLPAAYDAALSDKGLYWIMQVSLFGSAWLFWRAAFSQPAGWGAGWVFLAYVAMGMLGAILTLAPAPLYAAHAIAPLTWGLTPLADQQLGGLLMWVPAALPFAAWGAMMAGRAWRAGAVE